MEIFIEIEYKATSRHQLTHEDGQLLMDALLDLEKANEDMLDCGTATNTGQNTLTAALTVRAADEPSALKLGLHIVRTAIHTIGKATPGWPKDSDISEELFREKETRLLAA